MSPIWSQISSGGQFNTETYHNAEAKYWVSQEH